MPQDHSKEKALTLTDAVNTPPTPSVWDLDGIPEPTSRDLKWWSRLKKDNKTLLKHALKATYKGQVWRVASILSYRARTDEIDFLLNGRISYYSDKKHLVDFAALLECKDARTTLIDMLTMYGAKANCIYITHRTLYAKDARHSILALARQGQYVNFLKTEEQKKDKDFIFGLIDALGHCPDLLYAVTIYCKNKEYVEYALKTTPYSKSEDLYKHALDLDDTEIFHMLCKAKYEHELKGNPGYPIPIADHYIEQNLRQNTPKLSQKTLTDEWQKHTDQSIFYNFPLQENGTRLRDLFDFAVNRVIRLQEMPDGALNTIADWDMADLQGSAPLQQAREKLGKQLAIKTSGTAKPTP